MTKYVPGQGNPNAKLIVCGEAPGEVEEDQGIPFVGPTGQEVRYHFRENGMDWSEVYATNVSKWRPPDNSFKRIEEVPEWNKEKAYAQLHREVGAINPNVIVAVGGEALTALTGEYGITKWRGSIIHHLNGDLGRPVKVVPIIHPASYLRRRGPLSIPYYNRVIVGLDIGRAIEQSTFQEYRIPRPTIEIAYSSQILHRFIQGWERAGKLPLACDIETTKSVPTCIAFAYNRNHGISVPLLNLGGLQAHQITPREQVELWRLVARILAEGRIIGQNFKFDHAKIEAPLGMRIPNFYADTMHLAHTLHPELPKSLQFLTSIYTTIPYYKDEGKEFDIKKHSVSRLYTYNGTDAVATIWVFEELVKDLEELGLKDFYFDFVRRLHGLYLRMDEVGFAVNQARRRELWDRYEKDHARLEEELKDLVGEYVNVKSVPQIRELLFKKLKLPNRESTDEDSLVSLASTAKVRNKPQNEKILDTIIETRRVRGLKSKLKSPLDYDGRLRSNYNPVGTETGRTSNSMLRPPVRPLKMCMPFHNLTKHGDVGKDFCSWLVADPGYVLVQVDQKQAEARVVALLARDKKLLDSFDTIDVHVWTASFCLGIPESQITGEERFTGKTARHMGNYGAGKRRFMLELNTNARKFHIDINVSEWKAGEILSQFHAYSPKIRGVFHVGIEEALNDNSNILRLPNGRQRQFFDREGPELLKEAYAYIPQGTVGDLTKQVMLYVQDEYGEFSSDVRMVLEGHDGFVSLVKESMVKEYSEFVESKFKEPIDFESCSLQREPLVIPCEIKVGDDYASLKAA